LNQFLFLVHFGCKFVFMYTVQY